MMDCMVYVDVQKVTVINLRLAESIHNKKHAPFAPICNKHSRVTACSKVKMSKFHQ